MRAILEFNLPEESEEFNMATLGSALSAAKWELDNYLRAKIKYEEMPEEHLAIYQEIRDKLYELFPSED